jgi:hypothetical protein
MSANRKDVIFLSWGGEASKGVAAALQPILQDHFPEAAVFFSSESVEVGDDPLKRMFDEGLLVAKALVAVLTHDSASRPWVVWETATVWAKGRLVAPLFVDVEPGKIHGPLPVKIQGAKISDRRKVDHSLNKIAGVIGAPTDQKLTDEEWRKLTESVQEATSYTAVPSELPAIPADLNQRILPLNDGLHSGNMLAIEVRAKNELTHVEVLMTALTAPPGVVAIPAPTRMFWHPSRGVSNTIAQGAADLINIARVGPDTPGAVIDSPDQTFPWVLPNGAWRMELQITVKGYSAFAQLVTAAFNVRPDTGVLTQTIEWTEFTVPSR